MAENRELRLQLTVDDRVSGSLRNVNTSAQKLAAGTSQLDSTVRGLVGAYIGVQGLNYALKSTIGAAIQWEDAFAGVRKTVDATETQFAQINDELRAMATRIPVSVTELARIGEVAGQLGVDAENITEFTEVVAKLGVTTTLTTEEAANNLARIANIMQVPLDQVSRMGSSLVHLGNNFATTEREINDFALRIAGAGKIAGLATEDVFAIGAAMSSVGVQAEAGGTAVQKVLIGINTAVVQSSEELAVFANTAGMTADEFTAAWEQDAANAFAAFVAGLGTQGDDAINTLEELGLQDQRLIRSFLSLANAGTILEETLIASSEASKKNNAITEEAEKRFATTASQVQIFKNNLDELGIRLGTIFLPKLNETLETLTDWIEGWMNVGKNIRETTQSVEDFVTTLRYLPQAINETIGGTRVLEGALNTFTLGLYGVVIGSKKARDSVGQDLTGAVDDATSSTNALGNATEQLGGSLSGATSGVTGMSSAMKKLADKAEKSAEKIRDLHDEARKVSESIADDEAGSRQRIADEIIAQEQKIADMRKDIAERSSDIKTEADRKAVEELRQQLTKEEDALQRVGWLRQDLALEVTEAERRAGETAFERKLEDIQKQRVATLERHLERLQEIKEELAMETAKNTEITSSYTSAQVQIREDTKDTTEVIRQEAEKQRSLLMSVSSAVSGISWGALNLGGHVPAFRAEGGPVSAGRGYIVGEQGPELFVPGSSGNIVPNGAGGVTVNVTVHGDVSGRELVERVKESIMTGLRKNQKIT